VRHKQLAYIHQTDQKEDKFLHAWLQSSRCIHETKNISSPNSQLTSRAHSLAHGIGTRYLTQQRKQAHDQDLDSRPAFEFALLKEHEQNAAQEQPASTK